MHNLIKRSAPPGREARMAATDPVPVEPAPRAAEPVRAVGRKCLLVDDSRMIRKIARRIVEGVGYEVSEAENGEEALARCKVAMPDLILLDWNMPVMSGPEFMGALSQACAGQMPKVVFCTTESGVREIHQGIEAGASEFVIKPFDEASMLLKLRNIGAA